MINAFVHNGRIIARMVYIFSPALSIVTLLTVGWWGGSSSHKYLILPTWLEFCPGIFRFTRRVVLNLEYSIFLASNLCPFQTTWASVCTLCSCCLGGFPSIVLCLVFLEGAPTLSAELDGTFCSTCFGGSVPNFLTVSALVTGCLFLQPWCLAAVLWDYFLSLVPFLKGIESFWRECFAITIHVPWSLLCNFWYCCPLKNMVSLGGLPFSPTGFIVVIAVYTLITQRKRG